MIILLSELFSFFFFKFNFVENFHQECHQRSKQFEIRSVPTIRRAWPGSKCLQRVSADDKKHNGKHNEPLNDIFCLSNLFAADLIKIYPEIKKLNASEIAIISLMQGAIFVSLWRHILLIRYLKMK